MSSLLTLPPTKEKIIAQSVCEKIIALRRSPNGGDEIARRAIEEIISKLREMENEKLVNTIESELKKCHEKLIA